MDHHRRSSVRTIRHLAKRNGLLTSFWDPQSGGFYSSGTQRDANTKQDVTRLFQATGEDEWLELAKEYMRFVEGANDYLFRLVRAGKVGWAASVLYTLTGESKYKEVAVRIGENLIASQHRTGYWAPPQGNRSSDEVTAEMTIWLDEIDQAIGDQRKSLLAAEVFRSNIRS